MKKRQGKLPLWRPLKDWKRHEWAPMKEVWRRAEKVIGSDLRDMQHDLRQDFLDGRLIMGMRLFALDGTETRIILERECWQWLKINYAWSITGWEEIPGWKTEWEAEARKRKWERSALVVRRRELDKHYPAAATTPSEQRAGEQPTADHRRADDMRPPQRRRGPPTTHDWHSIDGEIARRCIDPKSGRVQVPKSESKLADEVLDWLAENEQGQPSVSEMREAVKRVCAALRPAQK